LLVASALRTFGRRSVASGAPKTLGRRSVVGGGAVPPGVPHRRRRRQRRRAERRCRGGLAACPRPAWPALQVLLYRRSEGRGAVPCRVRTSSADGRGPCACAARGFAGQRSGLRGRWMLRGWARGGPEERRAG